LPAPPDAAPRGPARAPDRRLPPARHGVGRGRQRGDAHDPTRDPELARERERDAGAARAAVLGPHRAAVRLDEPARDREAEAGAAGGARPRLVVAPEPLEHAP